MASVIYEYDMNQHGINKKIKIQVRDIVNNQTPEQGFPRDQLEVDTLNQIIAVELQKNQSGLINEAAALGERRQNLINDPIKTLIQEQATKAKIRVKRTRERFKITIFPLRQKLSRYCW